MSSTSVKTGAEVIQTPKTQSIGTEKIATAAKSNSKDEEICDDWEQLDQQKIEKSLQSIKINSNLNSRSNQDEEKTIKNESNQSSLNSGSPFTFVNNQFPQPSIKILKRPASNKKLNDMQNQNQNGNSAQPIKTFEQREQEYAQARLRILGSAHPEEDSSATSTQSSNSNQSFQKNNNSSTNLNNSTQLNKQAFNLIRDPVAPDGSKGFKTSNNNSAYKSC